MESEPQIEMGPEDQTCPECGAQETGYFCRTCGALLRGQDLVLCPRCHHVVPAGEFCNTCGQTVAGLALNLRQLAMAGDEFWVTGPVPASEGPSQEDLDWGTLEPDDSVELADAELPEWLNELPAAAAPPEIKAHIYPSLVPIEPKSKRSRRGPFFVLAMAGLGLTLLSVVVLIVYLILSNTIF